MLGKIFLKVSNKNNKILFVEVFGKNNMLKDSLINNVSKSLPALMYENWRKYFFFKLQSLLLRVVLLVCCVPDAALGRI